MQLSESIVYFLKKQGYVIVSSFDENGAIHCSAKGIVGIDGCGKLFIVDVYMKNTFKNLQRDERVSITAVDEHQFIGYTLQGKAKIVEKNDIEEHIIKEWESRVIDRISKRVSKSVHDDRRSKAQFEAELPAQPQYLIEVDIEKVIDLTPTHFKQ